MYQHPEFFCLPKEVLILLRECTAAGRVIVRVDLPYDQPQDTYTFVSDIKTGTRLEPSTVQELDEFLDKRVKVKDGGSFRGEYVYMNRCLIEGNARVHVCFKLGAQATSFKLNWFKEQQYQRRLAAALMRSIDSVIFSKTV